MNSGLRAEHQDVLRPAALVTPRCEAERLEPIDQIRDRHLLTIGSGRAPVEAIGGECADCLGQARRVDRCGIDGSGVADGREDDEAGGGNACEQR